MKALVLAAGLGTRLRPLTERLPKPLFPVGGRPMLCRLIAQLAAAGCEAVAVNTHHLSESVRAALAGMDVRIPIIVRHEPQLLGTGGAIANLSGFWDDRPFMVVNGDIVTDIDLAAVYRFHAGHRDPVTLVVTDCAELNSVHVDADGRITRLRSGPNRSGTGPAVRHLTFTGIQVLDPLVLEFLPPSGFAGSIEAYEAMMAAGHHLRAYGQPPGHWIDAGSPRRYRRAAAEALIPQAFQRATGRPVAAADVLWQPLSGDGSDRRWFRLQAPTGSLVLADHGLATGPETAEVDAFIAIGRHLHRQAVPVPAIWAAEPFAGQVLTADLGDVHLETAAARETDPRRLRALYRRVMAALVDMWQAGARGFDPAWCHQTPRYDRQVIVEAEGNYFLERFVGPVAGRPVDPRRLAPAFEHLARRIGRLGRQGFMHRDFQSRNILIGAQGIGIIDFQGGRIGPLQYDLASLLIDPYVDLAPDLQQLLLADATTVLGLSAAAAREFAAGYAYCALARNLQILGAFGFLWQVKGKARFRAFIDPAVAGLKRRLARLPDPELAPLKALVATL